MKTKSVLYIFAALLVLLAFAVSPVAAVKPVWWSNLKLVQKDANWDPVLNGAFGQFAGRSMNFNAEKLAPSTDYTLISYKEPWLSTNNVLASGKSDANGDLTIKGGSSLVIAPLICNDYAGYTTGDYKEVKGVKIWLVPSNDLTVDLTGATAVFNAWNPSTYLFETQLIPC